MGTTFEAAVFQQLDELVAKYDQLKRQSKYPDCSDLDDETASEFLTAAVSAMVRVAGPKSEYATRSQAIIKDFSPYYIPRAVTHVGGAVKALRNDVAKGYLVRVEQLVHASLFAGFLEMAEHLLDEGYKDPAAVLIGGVLEEHLRKLCDRNSIASETTDDKGTVRHRRAEAMNTDLAGEGVYSKLDQKNVTAWLDLRNKAAHGHYTEYTQQQVELLLQSVRDFLVRNPA